MTTVTRYDFVPLRATKTPEGYLVDSPVLTRVGIFEYRRADGSVRRELRREPAVFAPEHLASLRGKPITLGHPGRVSAANVRQHQIGTILSEGRRDGDHLLADIIIHEPSAVLQGGKRELSLGYAVTLREEPGEWNGQHFDAEQLALVADHCAIVDRGRAGVARLNLDGDDAESIVADDGADTPEGSTPPSPETTEEGQMPALVTVRLDGGLSYEAPAEVAHALTQARDTLANERARHDTTLADLRRQHETALAEANRRADAAEAERDAFKARETDNAAAVEQARADAIAATRTRMELEAEAKKHGVEIRADMTDRALREAVVRKLRSDSASFTDKSDEYVQYAFDHAVKDAATAEDAAARNRIAVNGGGNGARADGGPAPAGRAPITSAAAAREAMLRRRAAF